MPSYLYIGADERIWPGHRFKPDGEDQTVKPGDVIEAEVNPDLSYFDEIGADGLPVEPPVEPVVESPVEPSADEPAQEG